MPTPPDPYGEIQYPCGVPAHLHPARIAPLAALYGLIAPPPARARVLEIGCGTGENLIALAAAFPDASCTGLDLSAISIRTARANADACGLRNVQFLEADITTLPDLPGPFDYILCHGVYSWVPAEARTGILATIARTLVPDGLAAVSFNALPGWHLRQAVRETLLRHVAGITEPARILENARDLAAFLARALPEDQRDAAALRLEFEAAARKDPRVLWHDELNPTNQPFFLHDFVRDAAAHGLAFVSDTEPADALLQTLPPGVAQEIRSRARSRIEREQLLDLALPRRFHQCLLARDHHQLLETPDITRLRSCLVTPGLPDLEASGPITQPGTARFTSPSGPSFATEFLPGKIALAAAIDRAPEPVPFEELVSVVLRHNPTALPPAVRGGLLEFLFRISARGFIHWHTVSPGWTRTPGARPTVHPPARVQLANGPEAFSIHQRPVVLPDRWIRELLTLCDGTRDHAALRHELQARVVAAGDATAPDWRAIERDLPGILQQLAGLGLFNA